MTAVVAPDEPALLGLVSLMAPPLCAGATVVALASEKHPLVRGTSRRSARNE